MEGNIRIIVFWNFQGRNGKGSIYVWAAGNGGHKQDSCATDGYASSIYTIAVGSVDQYGDHAYYDEVCTSKMAVTFNHNTGSVKRKQIVSLVTDQGERSCVSRLSYTVASKDSELNLD